MRISDWSSDVCSSDLELQLMLLQPLDAETTYTAVITNITLPSTGLEANSSACRIASTDILLPWTTIQQSPAVTGRIRFHVRQVQHAEQRWQQAMTDPVLRQTSYIAGTHHFSGGRRATNRSCGDYRQNVSEVRSEEHTSELQSLMRISYAVFCLKQKSIYN